MKTLEFQAASVIANVLEIDTAVIFGDFVNPASVMNLVTKMHRPLRCYPRPTRP